MHYDKSCLRIDIRPLGHCLAHGDIIASRCSGVHDKD